MNFGYIFQIFVSTAEEDAINTEKAEKETVNEEKAKEDAINIEKAEGVQSMQRS